MSGFFRSPSAFAPRTVYRRYGNHIFVDIQSLTYLEGAELYNFNEDPMQLLEELMSSESLHVLLLLIVY